MEFYSPICILCFLTQKNTWNNSMWYWHVVGRGSEWLNWLVFLAFASRWLIWSPNLCWISQRCFVEGTLTSGVRGWCVMVRKISLCVVLFCNSLIIGIFVNNYLKFLNKYTDRNKYVTVNIRINIFRFDQIIFWWDKNTVMQNTFCGFCCLCSR